MKKAGKEEIKTFIKERLVELLNIDPQSIDENAFLVEDLGTTSIMIVDLLVAVEEEYGVDMQSRFDLVEPVSVNLVTDRILENMEA
ncbi:MAG: phosphopantetheine-binding protein [Clostridia bacterium]|nr:phosphopantetheine-binding protein [Clostridia bacterium]